MQKGLKSPSGQRQAKCGMPLTSVIAAVNQAWPIQAILLTALIALLPYLIMSPSTKADNPNRRTPEIWAPPMQAAKPGSPWPG